MRARPILTTMLVAWALGVPSVAAAVTPPTPGDAAVQDAEVSARTAARLAAQAAAAAATTNVPSMLRPQAASSAVADLRVDANRDGFVDRRAPGLSDDVALKKTATGEQGALMLPNLDDDSRRCPLLKSQDPAKPHAPNFAPYLSCGDAADDVVNGATDAADLATVAALPMPSLSDTARAVVTVPVGASSIRVFVKYPTGWQVLPASGEVPAELLRAGLELGVEGRALLGMSPWDGRATISLNVTDGAVSSVDTVALRVAPALMSHHLEAPEVVWYPQPKIPSHVPAQVAFGRDFRAALAKGRVTTPALPLVGWGDQYVQDLAEPMTVSMPRAGAIQSIRVLPIITRHHLYGLEEVVNRWRGPDVVSILPPLGTEHLNHAAGGNTEVIPPYVSRSGKRWPHGRLLMGNISMDGRRIDPDKKLVSFFTAQGKQGPGLFVNASWLSVGHIDEVVSFVPARTPRGWKMLIADPRAGDALVRRAAKAGAKVLGPAPRHAPTVKEFFEPWLRKQVAMAIAEVDRIEAALVAEVGLSKAEIVRVPVVYTAAATSYEKSDVSDRIATRPGLVRMTAALPNAINSQYLGTMQSVVPLQFGPKVGGRDIFTEAVVASLRSAGVTSLLMDDREAAWRGGGDIHCSTSVWRRPSRWWALR